MTLLPHAEHIEQLLARARELERRAKDRHEHGDAREANELYQTARLLRHEAQESHNAHVANELERAKSGPINLSDLMAGREAFVLDELDGPTGQTRR